MKVLLKRYYKRQAQGLYTSSKKYCKSGGKCGPHSMIVVGVSTDGVQVFDCNSDGRNTIKTYLYTWPKFNYDNRAMTLYHAYNYQGGSSSNKPKYSNFWLSRKIHPIRSMD